MGDRPRLLVGVDFSQGATAALDRAQRLARMLGSALEVVHVAPGDDPGAWRRDADAAAWLQNAGLTPDAITVVCGSPWAELVRRIRETGVTMLVVGTHGRSGAQPVAIGSTAHKLTLSAPCPVMLVNENARVRPGATPIRSSPAASS